MVVFVSTMSQLQISSSVIAPQATVESIVN